MLLYKNKTMNKKIRNTCLFLWCLMVAVSVNAQTGPNILGNENTGMLLLSIIVLVPLVGGIVLLYAKFRKSLKENRSVSEEMTEEEIENYLKTLSAAQMERFINLKKLKNRG
jgi:hypothetical protein